MKSSVESYFQRKVEEDLKNCIARQSNPERNKEISEIIEEIK